MEPASTETKFVPFFFFFFYVEKERFMIAIKFGLIQIPCPASFLWAESLGMSLCDGQRESSKNSGKNQVVHQICIHAERDFKIVSTIHC